MKTKHNEGFVWNHSIIERRLTGTLLKMKERGIILSFRENTASESNGKLSSFELEISKNIFLKVNAFESKVFYTSCKEAEAYTFSICLLIGSQCPPRFIYRHILEKIKITKSGLYAEEKIYKILRSSIETKNTKLVSIEKSEKDDNMNQGIDWWFKHTDCSERIPCQFKIRLKDLRKHKKDYPAIPGFSFDQRLNGKNIKLIHTMVEMISAAYIQNRILCLYVYGGEIKQSR